MLWALVKEYKFWQSHLSVFCSSWGKFPTGSLQAWRAAGECLGMQCKVGLGPFRALCSLAKGSCRAAAGLPLLPELLGAASPEALLLFPPNISPV